MSGGRPTPFKPEHARILRRLRAENPNVGLPGLAVLLFKAAGLSQPPSPSALHRFMQHHGISRAGYSDRPTDGAVRQLASQALQLALELPRDDEASAEERRAALCQNVAVLFGNLVWEWAEAAGVQGIDFEASWARFQLDGARRAASVRLVGAGRTQ